MSFWFHCFTHRVVIEQTVCACIGLSSNLKQKKTNKESYRHLYLWQSLKLQPALWPVALDEVATKLSLGLVNQPQNSIKIKDFETKARLSLPHNCCFHEVSVFFRKQSSGQFIQVALWGKTFWWLFLSSASSSFVKSCMQIFLTLQWMEPLQ